MVVTRDRQKISRGRDVRLKWPPVPFLSTMAFFLLLALGFPGEQLDEVSRSEASREIPVLKAGTEPFRTQEKVKKEVPPSYPFLIYRVEKGETLSLIAARFSLDPSTLISLNRLTHPKEIKEGRELYIPGEDGIRKTKPEELTLESWALTLDITPREIVPLGDTEYFLPGLSMTKEALQRFWKEEFSFPLTSDVVASYGDVYDGVTGLYRKKEGIELRAPARTPVFPVREGVVAKTGFHGIFGWYLIINHGEGFQSLYAHLDSFSCKEGEEVNRNRPVALSGNSGHTSGNILYLSLFKDGSTVDPLEYLN